MLIKLFLRFASAGATGTLCQYVILFIVVQGAGGNPVLGSLLGALAGAVVNYVLAYSFVFRSTKKHTETIYKFLIIAGGSLLLNTALMYLLTQMLHANYLLSQLLTSGLLLLYSFAANSVWTFKEHR
ncbi:GtrA family protein [Paraburkholderia sp.]|uniref:GtrA family protein n=1 Tax=Paraburkholderia sp. TaxID=1926495 RepID=UPI00239D6B01|nr:GtrA family protein [Paraburkholderia sp.]MDE1182977.1 GtrA family protein [Paraburkholderia sp.]